MKKKEKKYALVLSGGGFKGAFQLGAINYLNDNWESITGRKTPMKFDLIAGVSVGAINGAMLAVNKLGLLNELWLNKIAKNGVSEIYASDFIDTKSGSDHLKMKLDLNGIIKRLMPDFKLSLSLIDKLRLIFSSRKRKEILNRLSNHAIGAFKKGFSRFKAIADNTPLREKLHTYLDRERIKGTDFICGFVSLDDGGYKNVLHSEFKSNNDFVNGVIASTCIPTIWQPVKRIAYNQTVVHNLIDGGVKNVSPLGDVVKQMNKDANADYTVFIVNCHSGVNSYETFDESNIAQIAMRSFYDIAFTEIFNNDVKHFLTINDLVHQARHWSQDSVLLADGAKPYKAYEAIVIQPDPSEDLGNGLVANERLIDLRVKHGMEMAKKQFKEEV